jgi:hypothetical protein
MVMVAAAMIATANCHCSTDEGKASAKKRSTNAKAAALESTERWAVTGVGAPS